MSNNQTLEKPKNGAVLSQKSATAQFLDRISRDYMAAMGQPIEFSPHEIRLIQNLFARIEMAIEEQESQRIKKNKGGEKICWETINQRDLSFASLRIVKLGLDAAVKNHIAPTFRWIAATKKYKCLLNVGYSGADYVAMKYSLNPIIDRRYELVYSSDTFQVVKKGPNHNIESYVFEINQPFDRGEVIGGFYYFEFENPTQNILGIVTQREFDKAKKSSPSGELFWGKENWDIEMKYKTVVLRGVDKVLKDPTKIGELEAQALMDIEASISADDEAEALANREVLSLDAPTEPTFGEQSTLEPELVPATGDVPEF